MNYYSCICMVFQEYLLVVEFDVWFLYCFFWNLYFCDIVIFGFILLYVNVFLFLFYMDVKKNIIVILWNKIKLMV